MKPNVQDDSLPHQMRLLFRQTDETGHRGSVQVVVSCNCRAVLNKFGGKGSRVTYEGMGVTHSPQETQAIYYNPANHNQEVHLFEDAPEAQAHGQDAG